MRSWLQGAVDRCTVRHVCVAVLLILLFAIAPTLVAAVPNPLRSPWDGKKVAASSASYSCTPLARLGPDLVTDGFYRLDDPTHSIIDPVRQDAYNKSSGVVKGVGLAIVKSADYYHSSGSRAAAQCTLSRILTLAQDKSLAGKMSSSQAYYVQGWVSGAIAIAYLKVRDEINVTPEQNKTIGNWLLSIADQTKKYYSAHKSAASSDAQNNHLYWAGVEVAAIAVVANDVPDFNWAVAAYDNGVGQIRTDGTLPLEMARGRRALHYHLYSLAPLVLLAEFGEANGIDLYAHANGAIHRLVHVSIDGLHDPSLFEKATGVKQEVARVPSGDQIGWAPAYVKRFPDAQLSAMIRAAPDLSVYYLGGLSPD